MNEYDDSEEYSSANSFRARSNTWPLNRPDLAAPNGVSIDETLPEIDLEEDDLFTTNDNWTTGIVDHDIMSWDPILNAQQHQNQSQFLNNNYHHINASNTIHHQHQTPNQQLNPAQNQQAQSLHLQPPPHSASINSSNIIHHQQHQPQQLSQIHQALQQQPQSRQQLQPQHHQILNDPHCLDSDDHIQQLHHLHLDGSQGPTDQHQTSYISAISTSPICIHSSATALGSETYHISTDHHHAQQHQNLQQLSSARYDLDHQGDCDLKLHHHDQQPSLHHMTSSSLDQHSSTNILSSSLSTSGIGLSGDLEDLDYKVIEPTSLLQNLNYDQSPEQSQPQQPQQQQQQPKQHEQSRNASSISATKQQNPTSTSKSKLTTPRRNAWGNMSYADLISQAINSTNDKRLTLSEIYDWMVQHVPYFKDKGDSTSSAGWKNSVRHNLSLHSRFKRLQNEGTGKSSWWTINPEANVGKCARRRAASMEASKFEKKRGRAKKRADAIRQGLISYPSLTGSSLNGSAGNLNQSRSDLSSEQFGPLHDQNSMPGGGISPDNLQATQNPSLYQVQAVQQSPTPPRYEQNTNLDDNLQQQQKQPQQQQQQQQALPPQPNIPPATTTPPSQLGQDHGPPQSTPNQQVQQIHHPLHKIESLDNGFYYIQQGNIDASHQHHDQIHSQHQIMSVPASDLFGRHAIYMSEPCNDCNCAELVSYGTNAVSFT